jgi:hypothetical protein
MTIREIILMLNIIDTKLRLYYTNSANEDEKDALNNLREVRDDLHALMDDLAALAKERKGYIICTTVIVMED